MAMDLEDFAAFSSNADVAARIETDDGSELYTGFDDEDDEGLPDDAEPEEEAEDDGAESEGDDEDDSEEDEDGAEEDDAELDDEDPDSEPEPSGDRKTDGQNKAIWAARQKVRKEREARERAEQEVAYLKGLQAGLQPPNQAVKTEPKKPDEFDYSDLETSVEQRLRFHREQEEARRIDAANAKWDALMNASANEAREEYEDYDEVEKRFAARLQSKDGVHLREMLNRQPDPAEWVYNYQQRYEKRQARKDPRIAELEAELAAAKKKLNGGKKPPAKRTLARARGASKRSRGSTGPKNQEQAFDSLFARK